MTRSKTKAFTLVEVIASVAILSGIIVTVILWSADGLAASMQIEKTLRSTLLAEMQMEEIKTSLADEFNPSLGGQNQDLGDNYLANVLVTGVAGSPELKQVEVSVGYDTNGNGVLLPAEIIVTLATKVAKRE